MGTIEFFDSDFGLIRRSLNDHIPIHYPSVFDGVREAVRIARMRQQFPGYYNRSHRHDPVRRFHVDLEAIYRLGGVVPYEPLHRFVPPRISSFSITEGVTRVLSNSAPPPTR